MSLCLQIMAHFDKNTLQKVSAFLHFQLFHLHEVAAKGSGGSYMSVCVSVIKFLDIKYKNKRSKVFKKEK